MCKQPAPFRPKPRIFGLQATFALLATTLLLSACGTSRVRLMVVRPAIINAQQHGGVVTVGGIAPGHPNWHPATGHLRMELQQRILHSYGNVVRLSEFGGGLVIDGRLEDHGIRYELQSRNATCSVRVTKRVGNKNQTVYENRPCTKRSRKWWSRVAVVARVTTKTGQVVFLQRLVDTAQGETPERNNVAPMPNVTAIMHAARQRMAQKLANIVAPHRVQVTATLYDCPGRAEKLCEGAVAAFAHSDYDGALARYDQALAALQRTPDGDPETLAKIHYNKALVFKYSRRFDQALAELDRALQLDPGDSTYVRERAEVDKDRQRHHALIDQGLGGP